MPIRMITKHNKIIPLQYFETFLYNAIDQYFIDKDNNLYKKYWKSDKIYKCTDAGKADYEIGILLS